MSLFIHAIYSDLTSSLSAVLFHLPAQELFHFHGNHAPAGRQLSPVHNPSPSSSVPARDGISAAVFKMKFTFYGYFDPENMSLR